MPKPETITAIIYTLYACAACDDRIVKFEEEHVKRLALKTGIDETDFVFQWRMAPKKYPDQIYTLVEDAAYMIEQQYVHALYGWCVELLLSDGEITKRELLFLDHVCEHFKLEPKIANMIYLTISIMYGGIYKAVVSD